MTSDIKPLFVDGFAARLRESGVDAWLDKWEMLPGDSLVDKIFEEGLKSADAVIIVLSRNSVTKPWVREELNSGIIARLEKGTLLIPVVIDDCDLPEALKTTLWERIHDVSNYDDSYDRILAAIFGQSLKPQLGHAPAYTSTVLHDINGLEAVDNLVLKVSCEYLIENPDHPIEPGDVFGASNLAAPPKQEVLDSIDVLEDEGYVRVSRYIGGGPDRWGCHYRVTVH